MVQKKKVLIEEVTTTPTETEAASKPVVSEVSDVEAIVNILDEEELPCTGTDMEELDWFQS